MISSGQLVLPKPTEGPSVHLESGRHAFGGAPSEAARSVLAELTVDRPDLIGREVHATANDTDAPVGAAVTWSGAMPGLLSWDPDRGGPYAFVSGDATVAVSGRPGNSGLFVDAEFSDIRNGATGAHLEICIGLICCCSRVRSELVL